MLHPHTELRKINDEVGYGLFATRLIPFGTITWALDPLDHILDPHPSEQLEAHYHGDITRYSWVTGQGKRILCWDFGRFMNHSCEANTYAPGGCQFEIAVRDITPGEELTCDYATLNLEEPLVCQCGTALCRRIIKVDDLADIAVRCDALIRSAFTHLRTVPQPLWHWVEPYQMEITTMLTCPETIPSVLHHRWNAPQLIAASKDTGYSYDR